MVQIGWKAGAEQYPPGELLEYAIAAEKAGFTSIDISDHFHPWSEDGQATFAWTWLGAAAARTEKIELGTGVTCPILRYHPAVIAQATATLASLAPGRVYLGLGTGEALNEYAAMGLWPGYSERQAMLKEAITLIRQLWTGEEISFSGDYYETHKARIYTLPSKPIPIYISSLTPGSAEFAGTYGDGLFTVGGKPPQLYQQIFKNFDKGARAAGKDPTDMPRLVEIHAHYTDNIDAAIQEQLKYWASSYIPALFDQKIYSPGMAQENGEVIGPDIVKKMSCFSTNPDDHIKFVEQYVNMGFNTIYMHCGGPDQRSFIENYGKHVLPKLMAKVENRQKVGVGGS
jgi:coenzyme F420-dependent glucose-6-phosphate dehydrogenase